jgi:hypothetical protein
MIRPVGLLACEEAANGGAGASPGFAAKFHAESVWAVQSSPGRGAGARAEDQPDVGDGVLIILGEKVRSVEGLISASWGPGGTRPMVSGPGSPGAVIVAAPEVATPLESTSRIITPVSVPAPNVPEKSIFSTVAFATPGAPSRIAATVAVPNQAEIFISSPL